MDQRLIPFRIRAALQVAIEAQSTITDANQMLTQARKRIATLQLECMHDFPAATGGSGGSCNLCGVTVKAYNDMKATSALTRQSKDEAPTDSQLGDVVHPASEHSVEIADLYINFHRHPTPE